jgi:hypothetical protein
LAEPIRDVGSAGRRESVAGAQGMCGFGETRLCERFKDAVGEFLQRLAGIAD